MSIQEKDMITYGKKVRIAYTVTTGGQIVESTEGKPPLYYTHGSKSILESLQKKLEGLREGDTAEFVLTAAEAYGPFRPEAVVEIPKSEMPGRPLHPGMILQETLPGGKVRVGRIAKVFENTVLMDFNHLMAGKTLHYRVRVISVDS